MYIYGKNVAREKLQTNDKITKAYLLDNFNDADLLFKLKKKSIPLEYLKRRELDRLVHGLHQGIILELEDYKTYDLNDTIAGIDKKYPLIVMLDHLEDPHNFGAIIRSCVGLGVDAIIIPNDRSVDITGTVVKTSAGAIDHIKIIKVPNLTTTINYLKKEGYWIIGTDKEGQPIDEIDCYMPICLVIGNEGRGISPLVKKNCDFITTIQMTGAIDSLNASVASALTINSIINNRKK